MRKYEEVVAKKRLALVKIFCEEVRAKLNEFVPDCVGQHLPHDGENLQG